MKLKHRRQPRALIKRESIQSVDEEAIIFQYMIMNNKVCQAVYDYYLSGDLKEKQIDGNYRLIFKKVMTYYAKYEKAPNRDIVLVLRNEIKSDQGYVRLILEGIEKEELSIRNGYKYSTKNIIQDVIPRYIRNIKMLSMISRAENFIEKGNYSRAEELISSYDKVIVETQEDFGVISILENKYYEDFLNKQKEKGQVVFEFPEHYGDIRYIVGELKRGWLVSLCGTAKSGKSALAFNMGLIASLELKRNVIFFSFEMTEEDLIEERFLPFLIEKPSRTDVNKKYEYIPELDCLKNQINTCNKYYKGSRETRKPNKNKSLFEVTKGDFHQTKYNQIDAESRYYSKWKICKYCKDKKGKYFIPSIYWSKTKLGYPISKMTQHLKKQYIEKELKELKRIYKNSGLLKLCFLTGNNTLEDCINIIKKYEKKHKIKFDLVIFDYLDLSRPSSSNIQEEKRYLQVDRVWKNAASFAKEHNILIITPDQTTGDARVQRLLDHTTTPEAKSKDNHVDKKFGLVKFEEETRNNVCRINCLYDRHGPFDRKTEVSILQDLTHGRAVKDSVFWKDKNIPPYPIKLPD